MPELQEYIITTISSDATLRTMLGGSASDKRIYPDVNNKFEVFPCVTYRIIGGDENEKPANTYQATVEFKAFVSFDDPTNTPKTTAEELINRVHSVFRKLNIVTTVSGKVYKMFNTQMTLLIDSPQEDRLLYGKIMRFDCWYQVI
jgi:hypothetical protein